MSKLFLFIFSYGAFLLLLTPRKLSYIVAAFVIFLFGSCIAVYKKADCAQLRKNKSVAISLFSVFISACFGYAFYYRWLPAYILCRISSALHIPHETFLFILTLLLSVLSGIFVCVL